MPKVSAKHVSKVLKAETSLLYGQSSQRCRLEWITSTGGVLNEPRNLMVGKTDTLVVSADVAGIWGPVMRDQRERVNLDGAMISIDQLGFWYFPHSLNLANKDDLIILQKNKDRYYTGAGVGASAVWTPDTAPTWTVDEWIKHWLLFSDRRFRVTSNTTAAVTVDLTTGVPTDLQTLPTDSTSGELIGLAEWYPVRKDLGFAGGALSPLGAGTIFQSIFCSRIPVVGR